MEAGGRKGWIKTEDRRREAKHCMAGHRSCCLCPVQAVAVLLITLHISRSFHISSAPMTIPCLPPPSPEPCCAVSSPNAGDTLS